MTSALQKMRRVHRETLRDQNERIVQIALVLVATQQRFFLHRPKVLPDLVRHGQRELVPSPVIVRTEDSSLDPRDD